MTTDDIRNLQARLVRMGDTDAAHQVGVLLDAYALACEGAQRETNLPSSVNEAMYLELAEDVQG